MTAERLALLLDWHLTFGHRLRALGPFDASGAPRRRAWALLWRHLSGAQRRDLWWRRHFDVIGSDARRYRLSAVTRAYNVLDVAARVRYCAGPEGVPMGDFLLGQKLWLEADAARLLSIAHSGPWDLVPCWNGTRALP
ncbi:MAG: hypothetical protein M0015_04790 [Betaproteobacteria bacterium]|nr:hypothetical protein [Betaproteobacteria bacterium]